MSYLALARHVQIVEKSPFSPLHPLLFFRAVVCIVSPFASVALYVFFVLVLFELTLFVPPRSLSLCLSVYLYSYILHSSNAHLYDIYLPIMARFCSRTLLAAQILEGVLHKACDSAVEFLLEHNFVVKSGGSGKECMDYELAPTQLGRVSERNYTKGHETVLLLTRALLRSRVVWS